MRRRQRKRLRYDRIILLLLALSAVGIGLVFASKSIFTQPKTSEVKLSSSRVSSTSTSESIGKSGQVSFFAAGDNLIHGMVYGVAKANSTDGSYDFSPFYTGIKAEVESADIAFINQETPFAGEEIGGLSSYPTFNGPTQILEGLQTTGFDWINLASNHSFDRGEAGILAEIQHVNQLGILETGANASSEEQAKIKTLTKNGITIAFDSFTYGLNGYTLPEGKDYLVNVTSKELIKSQVEAMQKVSDVQVVNMHWGVEYSTSVDAEQQELAQYLADLGVDVIIAEHPHVIEPIEWITSSSGQKVLVVYSMGNLLSAQDTNMGMLGLTVKWNIKFDKGTVSVQDVSAMPTVTMITGQYNSYNADFDVKFLKDYTDQDSAGHALTATGVDMSRQFFLEQVNQIVGQPENVTVVD
ncbi:MAG: CapA family protein [Streptococcaceae bacterium]|jgi:poly-gamma-glutamate synthesis protein (capsule biosynthesis protein)|nr:CapA family protein [Streptococcaceae bacterium]